MSTQNLRSAVAVAVTLTASMTVVQLSAGQQQSSEVPPPATFRAEVNYVEVDVTVTDTRGNFLRGLGAEDFVILEDGKPQRVSTFRVVDFPVVVRSRDSQLLSSRIDPDTRSNSESDGRVFVLVLDDLHTHPLRVARAKETARGFIERYVGSRDLVSVIHTSGQQDANQQFTSQPSLLLASVDKLVGRKLRSGILERLEANQRNQGRLTQADIRLQHVFDPLDAERGRQAETMLAALQRVGEALADTRGRRKSVVLISEGIDYEIQSGVAQTESGMSTFSSAYAPSVQMRLRQVLTAMTRSNTAIYAVDPRGIATGGDEAIEVGSHPENPFLGLWPAAFQDELQRSQESLRMLSDETGGVASVNSGDFSGAFERIVRDNSAYYLLAYRSSHTRRDGRFLKIDVRVQRPDAHVRARKGYLAPSSRPAAGTALPTGPEPIVLRTLLSSPLPVSGMPLRAFAAVFKGPDPSPNGSVLLGLEIDARNLTFRQDNGFYTNHLEAVVVALDQQGNLADRDWHSVGLRLKPDTYKEVREHGLRLMFRLELAPGRYQLRTAVHEAVSGVSGTVHHDVEVSDLRKELLSVSGVVLASTSAAATPTPLPDSELSALLHQSVPTGSREFTSAETISLAFVVYQDPRKVLGTIDLATTLRGDDGRLQFKSTMEISSDELRETNNGRSYVVEIPLSEMASGTYVLRLQATSRLVAGMTVSREVQLHVRAVER